MMRLPVAHEYQIVALARSLDQGEIVISEAEFHQAIDSTLKRIPLGDRRTAQRWFRRLGGEILSARTCQGKTVTVVQREHTTSPD